MYWNMKFDYTLCLQSFKGKNNDVPAVSRELLLISMLREYSVVTVLTVLFKICICTTCKFLTVGFKFLFWNLVQSPVVDVRPPFGLCLIPSFWLLHFLLFAWPPFCGAVSHCWRLASFSAASSAFFFSFTFFLLTFWLKMQPTLCDITSLLPPLLLTF